MPSDIQIINPIEYPNWDNLLKGTVGDVFSNSSAWAKTLYESYNYKPIYFTVFEKNRLSALIPVIEINSRLTGLRGVSLPFTDYCNPIIDDENQFTHLFNYILAYGKKRGWKYFEYRNEINYLYDSAPSALQYFGHILDLSSDENQTYSRLRQSTKRNIKRAVQQGVDVTFHNSLNSLKDYYKLHCITRKRQGVPPQPFPFFKKIQDNLISKDAGFIVLGKHENKVIAGAVFFHAGAKAFYKYGASDLDYQELRANNLIMWEAIKKCCHHEYKSFCFGRTDLENRGLRQFKSGWGTQENIIKYYRYDLKKDTFMKEDNGIRPIYIKIFSKMPMPLLKITGTLLYKHIG